MIRQSEKYHIGRGYSCQKEREELTELLKEESKTDILRRIPLHSSRMSDFKFLCGRCYDELYNSVYIKREKKE
jgi:hypothetical protein